MTTHVTTHHPVRSDVAASTLGASEHAASEVSAPTRPTRRPSSRWALAGVAAGVLGIATMVTSSMINAVYDDSVAGDAVAITAKLADQTGQIIAFQVVGSLTALALVVFAAGLYRRLSSRLHDSIAPMIAAFGLLGTAVVTVLGTGLDTEFASGLSGHHVVPESAVMFNHWTGTIPWIWLLAGLSALAVFAAARQGAVPRWMGVLSLVLGGLTVASGVAPIQYMAIVPGALWVLILSVGFLVGDKAYRTN